MLSLSGCNVDYAVDELPSAEAADAPNPWDELDPGEMPSTLFALALDRPAVETGESDHWGRGGHIAVVDLRGSVLLEVSLPVDPTASTHRALVPLSDQRIAVAVESWEWRDGERTNVELLPFVIDLVSGEVAELLDWDAPEETDLRLASTGDRLFAWATSPRCNGSTPPLHEIDASGQRLGETTAWLPAELEGQDLRPFALDGTGNTLLLGLSDFGCSGPTRSVLVAWSPETGAGWWSELPGSTWVPHGARTAQESALTLERDGPAHRFRMTGEHPGEGEVPARFVDARPGPILDAASGTVVLLGERADGWDSLAILSEGREVWSIDSLRFGLTQTSVHILDAVVVD